MVCLVVLLELQQDTATLLLTRALVSCIQLVPRHFGITTYELVRITIHSPTSMQASPGMTVRFNHPKHFCGFFLIVWICFLLSTLCRMCSISAFRRCVAFVSLCTYFYVCRPPVQVSEVKSGVCLLLFPMGLSDGHVANVSFRNTRSRPCTYLLHAIRNCPRSLNHSLDFLQVPQESQ